MDKDLKKSTTIGDVSPLTTSSESETFDTWTVINDKTKDLTPDEIHFEPLTPELTPEEMQFDGEMAADALRVEVLKTSDDIIESRYNDLDDLSDGISIISDSESAGRISPHPELRKHLSDLNLRFITSPSMPLPMPMPTTPASYESYSERSPDTFHRVEPLVESSHRPRRSSRQLVDTTEIQPPLPRYGLRGLFYVGALLAVLAFISKIKYDAWESVLGAKTDMLQEKITDLELKNNLMRAEIDILAKQVNYLTTLSENKKYTPSSSSTKPKSGEKKVKVWPGNGNTIEEMEIPAKDLKKPFKCDGHNNVDIAGMCIELPRSKESVVDSIGEKMRVVIDENEYLSNFEKVVDRMAQMAENPFGEHPTEATPAKKEAVTDTEPDYIPHEHIAADKYDSKKHDKRDNYKKHPTKYDSGESKERERSPRRDRSNEDRDGERYKKSKEDYKKYDKRSSSEYENAKREADGQWHEKMMQHRENSRKNGDKHRHDNNWYIERGDSREQIRSTEYKYRGSGQR